MAEGDARGLQQFVAWCRRGPEEARVEGVTEQPGPATFEFSTFAVTR